ncbi:unnamed protein product [Paramecium pentaurelia]|uniref:Transmembrane protein n=1 Tax=Paramecium pentaurelia TaxID=43138 RepID=A0A8S1W0E1_9CILI|nr:unnamed protein product [Paramecium pentaurelia]
MKFIIFFCLMVLGYMNDSYINENIQHQFQLLIVNQINIKSLLKSFQELQFKRTFILRKLNYQTRQIFINNILNTYEQTPYKNQQHQIHNPNKLRIIALLDGKSSIIILLIAQMKDYIINEQIGIKFNLVLQNLNALQENLAKLKKLNKHSLNSYIVFRQLIEDVLLKCQNYMLFKYE